MYRDICVKNRGGRALTTYPPLSLSPPSENFPHGQAPKDSPGEKIPQVFGDKKRWECMKFAVDA